MPKNSKFTRTTLLPELRADEYFIRKTPSTQIDYEECYWGIVTDPDGKTRDRTSERLAFLETVKPELQAINTRLPGRILDIGCGLGFLLSGVDERWERHGVEISHFATERAKAWGSIHLGELEAAGYPGSYFDVVVLYHVIEHLEYPEKTILEARRVLADDGLLILGTPDFDSICARHFGANYRLLQDPTHISLFSRESMERFLRDHGFIINTVDFPFFRTPYFQKENLLRIFDKSQISPPFPGNFMTFYCRKMRSKDAQELITHITNRLTCFLKK
ncbi:MAG: hypothetical protein CFH10_00822 [Alphaproteobacteria bacterium MarineAlpha4_Bin2]|nr:MAG: hypothetical protein CFH10_00822 [Alphaproteobacteria bacterium MarineAlpha4_Bin2]